MIITLEQLPHLQLAITLYILQENGIAADLIIGRDFLNEQKITASYKPSPVNKDNISQDFSISLLQLLACQVTDSFKDTLNKIVTDFDLSTKKQLKDLILEVDRLIVPAANDDYSVKVMLKDDSVYAYAPRRFAWAKRNQIRNITDDLLARGIIKKDISSYCARVVPIKRKGYNSEKHKPPIALKF